MCRSRMAKAQLRAFPPVRRPTTLRRLVAFAPLLALGIPGSGTGTVLLGGLLMWGLQPGPASFYNQS